MKINISDTFKQVDDIRINIGDDWKEIVCMKINIGNVWKNVFAIVATYNDTEYIYNDIRIDYNGNPC